MSNTINNLPTNIITGFLGVGKTTAILHLLKQKPSNERWAILVNEFGEIGIDGNFFSGEHKEETGVYIREVAGGCMCCTSGLSMQISLNMLLARSKPDRLIIEPTGLGHPKEVISMLSNGYYKDVLDLRSTITLVDARKIKDSRYLNHETFNQQLDIADAIVANKSDQYDDTDLLNLKNYLSSKDLLAKKQFYSTDHGKLSFNWLNQKSSTELLTDNITNHIEPLLNDQKAPWIIPECGYLKIENKGEGFYSIGWLFDADYRFDKKQLFLLLHDIDAERIKAVFSTDQGSVGYNKADHILKEIQLDEISDNRIEIISAQDQPLEHLVTDILQCRIVQ